MTPEQTYGATFADDHAARMAMNPLSGMMGDGTQGRNGAGEAIHRA